MLRPRGVWVGLNPPREEDPKDDRDDEDIAEPSVEEDVDEPLIENEDEVIDHAHAVSVMEDGNVEAEVPKNPMRRIHDFPGFEGIPLSLEKAVKFVFVRPGTKEASRMLRVQNRIKWGTRAVPITIEEDRAAGVQAGDVLLLFGKSNDCVTVVVICAQYFDVGAEKALVHCSSSELRDSKTAIHGFIVYASVSPEDAGVICLDPSRVSIAIKNVPAMCTREINPEITNNEMGKAVWSMNIEETQAIFDMYACDIKPFLLPPSPSGNFPYHDIDGRFFFILAGSEIGRPDLTQALVLTESDVHVLCDLCTVEVKVAEMRNHIAAHLLYDDDWTDRPLFGCAFCGSRSAVPYTSAASMVAGCPTGLAKANRSLKHTGKCKLIGTPKYAHKAALVSTAGMPSTNVPIQCPKCPIKPGVFVFKYSMPKHYELEHSSHTMPPEFTVGDLEKQRLRLLWDKIKKKRGPR
jgi:hypothetical protein